MLARVDTTCFTTLTIESWFTDEDQLCLVPWEALRPAINENLGRLTKVIIQVVWQDVDKYYARREEAQKGRDAVGTERKIREGLGLSGGRPLAVEFVKP